MSDSAKSGVNWGMLCHLGGLATYFGIPFGNIIVPLVIWLVKRDTDSFVKDQGPEAVNFNVSYTLYAIAAGFLCYLLIGYVALPVVLIAHVVLVVQATLKANKGEKTHYPFTLRFIN